MREGEAGINIEDLWGNIRDAVTRQMQLFKYKNSFWKTREKEISCELNACERRTSFSIICVD